MDITVNENESASEPPGLPPAPSPEPRADRHGPKRLYRDPKGKIAGVASGLAVYFDIDPVITRLCFVVALLSGIGLPAYVVCWIVIPKAPSWPPPGESPAPGDDAERRALSSVTSGLIVVALAALIGAGLDGVAEFLLPAALLGFGVYLLNQRPEGFHDGPVVRSPAALADQESEPLDAPTPRSSLVTPTVLSVLALGLGLALALQAAGVVELSVVDLAAGGLLVVGAGLLASLWLGRAPGLIPTGLVLSIVFVGASVTAPWFEHAHENGFGDLRANDHPGTAIGEYEHVPRSSGELEPHYGLGMGELRLDLRQLDLGGETRDVSLHLGLGKLEVILPPDLSVELEGHVGIGEVHALGTSGRTVQLEDLRDGPDRVVVHFHVGVGEVQVRREL